MQQLIHSIRYLIQFPHPPYLSEMIKILCMSLYDFLLGIPQDFQSSCLHFVPARFLLLSLLWPILCLRVSKSVLRVSIVIVHPSLIFWASALLANMWSSNILVLKSSAVLLGPERICMAAVCNIGRNDGQVRPLIIWWTLGSFFCSLIHQRCFGHLHSAEIFSGKWQINLTVYVTGFIKQLAERDPVLFEQLCQVIPPPFGSPCYLRDNGRIESAL